MDASPSIDIDSLFSFLRYIGSYTGDLIFGPQDSKSIYHYTDLNGLKGIVESHDLWLSHSRYCNDEEELTYGLQIARKVLEEELGAKVKGGGKHYLEQISRSLETPRSEGVYVCCFCEKDNLLSQWRSYGANGTGVCIGFAPSQFSYVTGPDSPPAGLVRLWKVFYKEDIQRNIIRGAVNFHWSDWNKVGLTSELRVQQAVDVIQFFIPTFKNQDFEEEKEMRLIFTPKPDPKTAPQFRVSKGMLVPYYTLQALAPIGSPASPVETRRLPISSVQIGPSVNKVLNVESTQWLLNKAGYSNVKVVSSNTPYRG